jgi:hypothetical protein
VLGVSLLKRPALDQPARPGDRLGLLSNPRQVRHQRSWLTHPVVPIVLFAGSLITGGILASEVVAWAAFGALAGYSLSGST